MERLDCDDELSDSMKKLVGINGLCNKAIDRLQDGYHEFGPIWGPRLTKLEPCVVQRSIPRHATGRTVDVLSCDERS